MVPQGLEAREPGLVPRLEPLSSLRPPGQRYVRVQVEPWPAVQSAPALVLIALPGPGAWPRKVRERALAI
jgi:hypothetical protein